MTPRLLLLKIITLLHLESQIMDEDARSPDLAVKMLTTIKIPEGEVGLIDSERDIIGGLYNICRKLITANEGECLDKSDLLQEVRMQCGSEVDLYDSFKEGIILELSQEGIRKRVSNIRRELKEQQQYDEQKKKVLELSHTLRFKENTIDDMAAHLRGFVNDMDQALSKSTRKDEAITSEFDMSDPASVEAVAGSVIEEDSQVGILKTHLQGVNDMMNGGHRRGEFVCSSALPSNNKTGFSLDYFAGVAIYNEPFLFNKNKKPLLLRISFEDDIEMNFRHWYKHLWEQEFGMVAITKNKTAKEMSSYVINKFTATGWEIRVLKVDPSMWTIFDLFAYVRDLESEGYEIALCMLDYMAKMPTTGCLQGIAGLDIKDMAKRCKVFFNKRKIAFFTPHQISTQAKEIQRQVPRDFVKMLPNGGYYEGCKGLNAEIDFELFQHIELQNGHSFLTLHAGRHRGAPALPESKKYLVYQFSDVGGIAPDMGKERSDLSKVGAPPNSGRSMEDMDFM